MSKNPTVDIEIQQEEVKTHSKRSLWSQLYHWLNIAIFAGVLIYSIWRFIFVKVKDDKVRQRCENLWRAFLFLTSATLLTHSLVCLLRTESGEEDEDLTEEGPNELKELGINAGIFFTAFLLFVIVGVGLVGALSFMLFVASFFH